MLPNLSSSLSPFLSFFCQILLELLVCYEPDTGLGPGAMRVSCGAPGPQVGSTAASPHRGEGTVRVACPLPSMLAPPGGGSSAQGEGLGGMDSIPRSVPSQSLASLMGAYSSLFTE